MGSQRTKDRLTGAAVTLLVLLLVLVVLVWWVTEPADDSGEPSQAQPPRPQIAAPPADLSEGETWLSDLVLDAGAVETPDASLRDVTARARNVRNRPTSLDAGWLSVDATVPFEVVAEELGGEGTTVRGDGPSRATVVRDVDVLGRQLRVVATGTVEVVSGRLVVEPRTIDVGGPDFLSRALGDVARALVTIEHDIEGLPEGLVLQDVTVQDDGFRANLQGEDVRLVS
jgi:hypothetical protein